MDILDYESDLSECILEKIQLVSNLSYLGKDNFLNKNYTNITLHQSIFNDYMQDY